MQPGRPFVPMEPKSLSHPFDDPEFGFQVKWDGVRMVAHVVKERVRLYNRKMRDRTRQYPEIVAALTGLNLPGNAILDGELVSLVGGKPDFHRVLRRDRATRDITIRTLCQRIPVTYILFDILYLGGPLVTQPFRERDRILRTTIPSRDSLVITDTFPATGKKLFSVIREQGLEGIVAKRFDSPYLVGKTSGEWLKIKCWRRFQGLVGGYTRGQGGEIGALLLGRHEGGKLVYVGRVAAALPQREKALLAEGLRELAIPVSPFQPPPLLKVEQTLWVKPVLPVWVEFLDWSEEGYLRQPVLKGFGAKPPPGWDMKK